MNVTLIQPQYHNIWEALWAGYIASYCKANYEGDLEFNFFHGNFDKFNLNVILESDVVAFSCTTPTFMKAVTVCNIIKMIKPTVKTVIGGFHVTALAHLTNLKHIDHIVIGEGESAFLNILNGESKDLVFGDNMEFSELPWPDRELIGQGRTLDLCYDMCKERIASVQSVRGCKMNCKMCSESCMTGIYNKKINPLRVRDPFDTLDEIDYIHKDFKIDKFKFVDPTWSISEKVVNAFCEEKIKRGNTLPWDCMVHAGFITENSLKIMKEANCDIIMIGCESGDNRILKDIRKGVTVEQIKKVFKWGKETGLNRRAFFIIGTPLEDAESIQKTHDLVNEIQPDLVGATILCPYPGSDYYDHSAMKDLDWSKADEYSNDFWETENFDNKELKKMQEFFVKTFNDNIVWHNRMKNE